MRCRGQEDADSNLGDRIVRWRERKGRGMRWRTRRDSQGSDDAQKIIEEGWM